MPLTFFKASGTVEWAGGSCLWTGNLSWNRQVSKVTLLKLLKNQRGGIKLCDGLSLSPRNRNVSTKGLLYNFCLPKYFTHTTQDYDGRNLPKVPHGEIQTQNHTITEPVPILYSEV